MHGRTTESMMPVKESTHFSVSLIVCSGWICAMVSQECDFTVSGGAYFRWWPLDLRLAAFSFFSCSSAFWRSEAIFRTSPLILASLSVT